MQVVKGVIDCDEFTELPSGSVVFIHFFDGDEVVGQKTLQSVSKFPLEFKFELERDVENKNAMSIQVQVEKSEETLFVNEESGRKLSHSAHLDNLRIELVNPYKKKVEFGVYDD